ncbi:low temperature requirement protein A [Microbacterium sp.]|uniref:low temperature requirement protein A n=1 Tax=Microbacterium sp. TaxID=51671 RepID=UPI0039E34C79
MTGRDPHESGRAASPLELFFDLVFVVAVSFSSVQLHHMEADGHLGAGVLGYLMVFFAVWWSWMNFTWFATSFDTDDVPYRLLTFVQMAGVLVVASGAADAMEHHDFTVITIGYVIMRLAMVTQWLRVAVTTPRFRVTALRYAGGILVVQIAWVLRLFLPETIGFIGFFVLVAAEIAVPVWAESHTSTPWNPHHITERYGLFTLILLGESILASANAVVEALKAGEAVSELLTISAAGLVIAAGMWWIYFSREHHHHITSLRSSLVYGYSHYFIFAAAGAFSAGIEVIIDISTHHAETAPLTAGATLTIPVAIFILGIWALTIRRTLTPAGNAGVLIAVVVIVAATFLPGVWVVVAAAAGTVIAVVASRRPVSELP